jgi:hypothetical protein
MRLEPENRGGDNRNRATVRRAIASGAARRGKQVRQRS